MNFKVIQHGLINHVQLSPELLELISTLIKIERDNLTIICNELDEEIDHLYHDEIDIQVNIIFIYLNIYFNILFIYKYKLNSLRERGRGSFQNGRSFLAIQWPCNSP